MSALTTTHWRRYTWGRSICEPVVPEQIDLQFRNRFSSGIYQALGYTSCWNLVFPFNLFSSMKLMFHHGSTANYGCTVLWSSSSWLIDSRWIGLFAHWFFFFRAASAFFLEVLHSLYKVSLFFSVGKNQILWVVQLGKVTSMQGRQIQFKISVFGCFQ